jgi:mannosyltransferase
MRPATTIAAQRTHADNGDSRLPAETTPHSSGYPRFRAASIFAVPAVLTFVVSVAGIGHRQLWRDEHATWWAASLPLGQLHRLVEVVDVVLLPYYLLMHVWVGLFGDSAVALRLPSAIFMAAAAGLLALVGRRLLDEPAGLLAGVLFAALPAVSRYGQEARPYAMAVCASVLAVLLLLRAVERPTRWRWLAYAGALVWVACSHLVALMALAAHLSVVLAAEPGRRRGIVTGWLSAVLGALVLAGPIALLGHRQGGQISWIPEPDLVRFPAELFGSAPVAWAVVAAGVVFAVRARGAVLWCWAAVPPVIAYLTFDRFHFFYPRYLLFTVPAWVLAAAWVLRQFRPVRAFQAVVAVSALLAVGLLGLAQQRSVRSDTVEDEYAFAAAARYVVAGTVPGDGVAYAGYSKLHRAFAYEFRNAVGAVPREVLSGPYPGKPWWWNHQACREPACLAGVQRFWLVTAGPRGGMLDGLPAEVAESYTVVRAVGFHRLTVTLLVRSSVRTS